MTRTEAIETVRKAGKLVEADCLPWVLVDSLAALGVLKLDEPKPRKCAIDVIAAISIDEPFTQRSSIGQHPDLGPSYASRILTALHVHGFTVVRTAPK